MSLSANINEKANLIWAIADKLTGVYKPHEYGKVILPLTVIRRFDCILSDTKQAVYEKHTSMALDMPMRDKLLKKASGFDFYNTSKYTFETLLDDANNIELNFRSMLLSFFIVSLLAKASIMNCKLRVSSGVAFFKWKSNPNNLTVVKTNLPLNRGSNSNPADTWFALKRTDLF